MFQISLNSGAKFNCKSNEIILTAAEKSSVFLPSSCRNGRCNSCRCRVISGSTRPIQPELGINAEDIRLGWILSCVRIPESDVVLDIEDLNVYNLSKPNIFPCKVEELSFIGSDILIIYLRLPISNLFKYIPGQYVEISNAKGIKRSYSIACGFAKSNIIELHVKRVPNGQMSEYWFESAKKGDLLRLYGPLGSFFLRNYEKSDLIFLATGTGIAPIKAILEYLNSLMILERPRSVSLYWGCSSSRHYYLNINSISDWIDYFQVISRFEENWRGATGYVQDLSLLNIKDFSNTIVYACGSEKMINNARNLLLDVGLAESNFYADPFLAS